MCDHDKTKIHKRNEILETQLFGDITIECDGLIIATHTQRDRINYSLENKFTEDICKKTLFNYIKKYQSNDGIVFYKYACNESMCIMSFNEFGNEVIIMNQKHISNIVNDKELRDDLFVNSGIPNYVDFKKHAHFINNHKHMSNINAEELLRFIVSDKQISLISKINA
jgi:hypothetical protein